MTLWSECCVFGEEAVEGVYVGCNLKRSEQKEKGSLWVVAVDAGLSYERTLGLEISRRHRRAGQSSCSRSVGFGVHYSAFSKQRATPAWMRSIDKASSSFSRSRARLQMRTPLSDGRMTWIAEWLLHEVADVTWGGEGQSVWKPCWQEIVHVRTSLSRMLRLLIPKTIGNRKRDCAWGCAWGINTTWEICRSKSTNQFGERNERLPDLCFSICRFSQVVFIPQAQPHAQSLFLFPIVFGINLIHFFDFFRRERRTVQPEIRSCALCCFDPLSITPFDSAKNTDCFEKCNVFGNGKCELSAFQKVRNWDAQFWQGKAQNSSPILRCTFLARRSAKLIANFSAAMVTSLPSFSLSLSLCISLSLSLSPNVPHAQYRKRFRASHNTC